MELIGFAQALGFEIVAAGKGKNNALQFDATPDALRRRKRAQRNMNARMLVEFVDGSKTAIEMTAVANATGLVPDVPGMHGPKATREELAQVLCTKEDGGILNKSGVVDYSIGKGVAPGVFCVVKPPPSARARAHDRPEGGPGPVLQPAAALPSDKPRSAAVGDPRRARCTGADLEPLDRPVGECAALAKRDLDPGQILGKIGEYDYRGFAMEWLDARKSGRDAAGPRRALEGAEADQGRRKADLRKLLRPTTPSSSRRSAAGSTRRTASSCPTDLLQPR